MNKKAVELSINFMVVLIITLVVFGMALYLLKMFFGTAEELKQNIDTQTEKEIQRVLFGGERVAIPLNTKEIKRGSSGVFGLGILNVGSAGSDFTIAISQGPLILQDNTQDDRPEPLGFMSEYKKTIENNEHVIVSIPVRVERSSAIGTYVLNVYVCAGSGECSLEDSYDGNVHKIYVNVV